MDRTHTHTQIHTQCMLFRCCISRESGLHSNQEMDSSLFFPFCTVSHNANEHPLPSLPPYTDLSSLLPASPSSSCSESGLQFVPLPHTSLFKMTLLHFMVNQLFCLTQSTGSASQPARISWGAGWWWWSGIRRRRERRRERMRETEREKENKRKKGKKDD